MAMVIFYPTTEYNVDPSLSGTPNELLSDDHKMDDIFLLGPIGRINCIDLSPIEFRWTSNPFISGTFRLKIIILEEGQQVPADLPDEGLFYEQNELSGNSFVYPAQAPVFEENLTYAWQIERPGFNGEVEKSAVATFTLSAVEDCTPELLEVPTTVLCPGDCMFLTVDFPSNANDRSLIVYTDHPNPSSVEIVGSSIAPYPISALNDNTLEDTPHLAAALARSRLEICINEGTASPINFSVYAYRAGSACQEGPFSDCCCYGLQEFSVEVADIPDFQSLELTLKDGMGVNPIQEICTGEQVVFSISNLPTTENTSLLWQYSDDNGVNWIDITVLPFVQEQESTLFTFPVFPGNEALVVNCSENTAGFVDRTFRAQLEVTKDNTVCTYFTSEYTLKICCPISEANIVLTTDNEEVDLDVGLCEGNALNLMVALNSEDLFLQPLGDFVHIKWSLNNVDLEGYDDQIEFDEDILVETTDICVEAEVTNCAGKIRTFTKCIQVDPEPICGTISLVDPAVGSIIEGDIQVYEVCPGFAGTLEAEGFDPNNCTVHWEYSYDQITWTPLGVSNTRQNTNIIIEGDFTSIFYRVQCFPKSDPSGCDPCLSNIIEIRENVVPPADPIIDCSAIFYCEGANATLSVATFEENVTYTWFVNGVAISNEATLNYPLTKNTCFQYEATNACYTVMSEACCVELCEVVAVIRCPFQVNNNSDCASLGEPIVLLGSDSQSNCAGNDLSYEWSWTDGNGQAQNQNSIAITDTPPLSGTTYTLTVTDNLSGCTDTTSLTIIPCDEQ